MKVLFHDMRKIAKETGLRDNNQKFDLVYLKFVMPIQFLLELLSNQLHIRLWILGRIPRWSYKYGRERHVSDI